MTYSYSMEASSGGVFLFQRYFLAVRHNLNFGDLLLSQEPGHNQEADHLTTLEKEPL